MKTTTTAAASHCLRTPIHIHVNQILVDPVMSRGFHQEESGRPQIRVLVSHVCLPDWMPETCIETANHVVGIGCYQTFSHSTLVSLSQEHTTFVEINSRKKENCECVDGEHGPTDVEMSSLVSSFIQ